MPADPRERAGRRAAILYLLGALDITVRSAFLTEPGDQVGLVLFAIAVAAVGVTHLHLPWRRWPGWALLVPFLGMLAAFSVVAGAACGQLSAFLPLYGVAFIFIGLTQPVGTATLLAIPSIATSVAVTFGSQPRDTLIDIILAVILGTVIGELLAVFRTRQERSAEGVRQLLDASNELVGCADVASLFRVTSWWTRQILDADGVLLLQPGEIHQSLYTSRMVALKTPDPAIRNFARNIVVDVASGPSGTAIVADTRRPLFVRDGRRDPRVATAIVRALGGTSVLFVPVIGGRGPLAVLVAWWRSERCNVDRLADRLLQLLSRQAAPVLERIQNIEILDEQAHTDPLTGLANRRSFDAALAGLPAGGAVAVLDLDHFKRRNDMFGHAAGDETLVAFAKLLRDLTRSEEVVARYGGEEFVIAVRDEHAARRTLARLREQWMAREPYAATDPAVPRVTFSAGIAVRRRGERPQDLILRADRALYRAKTAGRDRVVVL
ncbi:MAG: GGDEF domain-containing protein [Frankiaceae bacterium]